MDDLFTLAPGQSSVAHVNGLPDALIVEQRQDRLVQPGNNSRWGQELARILSRPRPQKEPSPHGFAFVGGWLDFMGELSRT
jgi:hypothetical protein